MESQVPYQTNGNDQAASGKSLRQGREQGYLQWLPVMRDYVRLRPVTPDILIETGEIPDLLTPLVIKMLYDGVDNADVESLFDPDQEIERARASLHLIHLVCRMAFVEPRIVDDPQADDEIHISDIDFFDKGHVFSLSVRGTEVLRRFRDESAPDVELVPDQQDEPQPA